MEDDYTNGLAAHRLSREVQKLAPGARANLRIYSAGRFRDVQVTAGKASEVRRLGGRFNFMMPGHEGMMEFKGPDGAMMFPDLPMLRKRIELENLPNKFQNRIQIRRPARGRTVVALDAIRELAASAVRDAQSALRQLAADQAA